MKNYYVKEETVDYADCSYQIDHFAKLETAQEQARKSSIASIGVWEVCESKDGGAIVSQYKNGSLI